jgi:CRP-like cAMP-binding protein
MPGEYIINKGDIGHEMYFITNGKAKVYVHGKCVDTKNKGEFFGEISLLWPSRRTANIIAQDYCFVKILNKKHLKVLENLFPGITLKIRKGLWYFGNNHEMSQKKLYRELKLFSAFENEKTQDLEKFNEATEYI